MGKKLQVEIRPPLCIECRIKGAQRREGKERRNVNIHESEPESAILHVTHHDGPSQSRCPARVVCDVDGGPTRAHRTSNEGSTHREENGNISGGCILCCEENREPGANHWSGDAQEKSSLLDAHRDVRKLYQIKILRSVVFTINYSSAELTIKVKQAPTT